MSYQVYSSYRLFLRFSFVLGWQTSALPPVSFHISDYFSSALVMFSEKNCMNMSACFSPHVRLNLNKEPLQDNLHTTQEIPDDITSFVLNLCIEAWLMALLGEYYEFYLMNLGGKTLMYKI